MYRIVENQATHQRPESLEETEVMFEEKSDETVLVNPFPGLRPFGFEESHLFFGREGQTGEILSKLAKNRFVGVIGASGSGKSSLMSCGLLPVLYGGFTTHIGSAWKVFTCRPGLNPFENLAEAIYVSECNRDDASADNLEEGKKILAGILKSSSRGLMDALRSRLNRRPCNVLVFVDQLEEIFRLMEREERSGANNEVAAFLNMLLSSVRQPESQVYVAITLRSDYIGETAHFPELTKAINDSHYLIPQMTRDQLQSAIEGPVAVGGGKISKRLVQQLLNDLGSSVDKLPVLQHALMRTWDYWMKNKDGDEPVDLRHYHAIGRLTEALSLHADETYNELTPREKEICEVMFKSLTEKGRETYGVRRPGSIQTISEIAGVSVEEAISVAEKFRQPGRSLIMPPTSVPLNANAVIEISHESLMWIWNRLKVWVNEEADSAQMYIRLSEAAEMYQFGRTGLWRPPDLQLALNWQQKQNPSLVWAQRYNPYYERAIVFLESSKKAYDDEQKMLALVQKRRLHKARVTSLILGMAAVISILFFIFAVLKKIDADNQAQIARQKAVEAESNFQLAEQRLLEVDRQRTEAEEAREEATRYALESEKNFLEAQNNAEIARVNQETAEEQAALAERQADIALKNEAEARLQKGLAEENEQKAWKLRLLSIAQSMAVKSLQERDPDLKGLLALQAYYFNRESEGDIHDAYIYDGLYFALRQLENDSLFYRINAHSDVVRSITFSGDQFFSAGSDGNILKWKLGSPVELIHTNKSVNRVVRVSGDGKWLINGGQLPYIQILNLEAPQSKPVTIKTGTRTIYDIQLIPGSRSFISTGSDSALYVHDTAGDRLLAKINSQVKTLALNEDGSVLAGGTADGKVILWNTADFVNPQVWTMESPVHSVSFNHAGTLLGIGDENGNVTLIPFAHNTPNDRERIVLTGHSARINDVKFSPDDLFLGSAGFDGRIQLWRMNDLDQLPVVLRDHQSFVWAIAFSADGKYLASGSRNGTIKLWPTNPDELAGQICSRLTRNMTVKEWERYVAPDIPYRSTCHETMTVNQTK